MRHILFQGGTNEIAEEKTKDNYFCRIIMLATIVAGVDNRTSTHSFSGEVAKRRDELKKELEIAARELKSQLPEGLLNMRLVDFMLLQSIVDPTVNKNEIDPEPLNNGRRMTRSATRVSSIARKDSIITQYNVPNTPSFNPALPETPADVRRAVRQKRALADSNIFVVPDEQKKVRRITRATIRNIAPAVEDKKSEVLGGTISVELADGKTVDLDLTQSPSRVVQQIGQDKAAMKDLRGKMKQYASQLKTFFKKLQF